VRIVAAAGRVLCDEVRLTIWYLVSRRLESMTWTWWAKPSPVGTALAIGSDGLTNFDRSP